MTKKQDKSRIEEIKAIMSQDADFLRPLVKSVLRLA